jgi:multidrug efflux pump subunit AcrA (membrane-fusion protein)
MKKLAVFFTLFFIISCSESRKQEEAKSETRSVKVTTAVAKKEEIPSSRTFSATVASDKTALIIPKVVGYIESVNFAPGSVFKAGDLLVSIKSGELEEKKRYAESAVAEAESGYNQAEIGHQMAIAQEKQAESNFNLAEKTYRRYSNLIKNNSVSRQEFDQVEAQYSLAGENLNIAKQSTRLAAEKIQQVMLKKQQAEAMLAEVNAYLSYTNIRAPFGGIVLEKLMDAGNLAAPGNPILKIGTTDTVVYAFINESLIGSLRVGMSATVEVESIGFTCETEITEISPDIDSATRNFRIKLRGNDRFIAGMYAKVVLPTGTGKTIVVPPAALVQRGQLTVLFVVREGKADMRIVKTGQIYKEGIEIISGLNEGDVYITDNASSLKTGDSIEAE